MDRTKEFLGSGDLAIVRMRRELFERIKQSESPDNVDATRSEEVDYRSLRALALMIDNNQDIKALTEEKLNQRRQAWS
ncbi:hypothetical protein D3C84_1222840 [compost metagenome]